MIDLYHKIELLDTIDEEVNIEEFLDYVENHGKMTKNIFRNIIKQLIEINDVDKVFSLMNKAMMLRRMHGDPVEEAMNTKGFTHSFQNYLQKNGLKLREIILNR